MITKEIMLREDNPKIVLKAYISDARGYVPDAMLVLPGGGYTCVCDDREGEPIALAYLSKGFHAFVLKYSVGPDAVFPEPLIDASLAVAYIRNHAEEFHINPERIFAVGFSAGGHLCAMLGTMWNHESIYKNTDLKYGENKIAGMILCYPVVTGRDEACDKESFDNLIGTETPTQEQLSFFSIENQVSEETVPAFIMHTAADEMVPAANSIYLAEALAKHHISFELHIYPNGPHGMALATPVTSGGNLKYENARIARWVDDSCVWIKENF